MKVLVLEDDYALRYMFRQALEDNGYEVHEASNLYDARNIILSVRPEIVVFDLMIGKDMSLELAGLVTVLSPDTEVIYVTGSDLFTGSEFFSMQLNVSLVLRKPVDLRHLLATVEFVEQRHPTSRLHNAVQERVSQCA